MDPYKRLKLEFKGIKDVIEKYTSQGNIRNFLNGLQIGLETDDFESVLYYLNEICEWYSNNIGKIHGNEYVFNKEEHVRNKKILEEIKDDLDNYDFSQIKRKNDYQENNTSPKIFLSHSSSDTKYGHALEKLIVGLGVENDQLVYTSHPLHKIPLDQNIYEYLRKNINQKVYVIILWSNKYLESPACLNEMGAAWVTQTDYTNIYTPDFDFGNPKYHQCAVDTRKMGAVLNGNANCKVSILELRNKILEMFELKIDEQTWTYLIDQFITEIS